MLIEMGLAEEARDVYSGLIHRYPHQSKQICSRKETEGIQIIKRYGGVDPQGVVDARIFDGEEFSPRASPLRSDYGGDALRDADTPAGQLSAVARPGASRPLAESTYDGNSPEVVWGVILSTISLVLIAGGLTLYLAERNVK